MSEFMEGDVIGPRIVEGAVDPSRPFVDDFEVLGAIVVRIALAKRESQASSLLYYSK
jgi:hypothetical protein